MIQDTYRRRIELMCGRSVSDGCYWIDCPRHGRIMFPVKTDSCCLCDIQALAAAEKN